MKTAMKTAMKKAIIIIGIIFAAITANAQVNDTLYVWNLLGECIDTAYVTNDSIELHFDTPGIYYLQPANNKGTAERVMYMDGKLEKAGTWPPVNEKENENDSRRPVYKLFYVSLRYQTSKQSNHEDIHHHLERDRNL